MRLRAHGLALFSVYLAVPKITCQVLHCGLGKPTQVHCGCRLTQRKSNLNSKHHRPSSSSSMLRKQHRGRTPCEAKSANCQNIHERESDARWSVTTLRNTCGHFECKWLISISSSLSYAVIVGNGYCSLLATAKDERELFIVTQWHLPCLH